MSSTVVLSRRHWMAALPAVIAACRTRSPSPAGATRIVSLSPATTACLLALGAGARLVGVSDLCELPRDRSALPRLGTMVGPRLDALRALRPDAVVMVEGPCHEAFTRGTSLRVVAPRMETVADVRAGFDPLAALLGTPDASRALRASLDARLARIAQALAGRARPRVAVVIHRTPLVLAGRNAWLDGLLPLAGAENAVSSSTPYPLASVEQVQSYVPEVIVDLSGESPSLLEAWSGHTSIPAVANHRVIALAPSSRWRQGPHLADAAADLARALHPGISL